MKEGASLERHPLFVDLLGLFYIRFVFQSQPNNGLSITIIAESLSKKSGNTESWD
jgi:hypothetical protein